MARDYRRTKSRLARRQSQLFMRQTGLLIFITLLVIFAVLQFGVPLLIKLAVFLGDLRGPNREPQNISAPAVLVPPTLQALPEATNSARLDIAGFAQAGVLVSVFINGNPQDDLTVDSSGEFTLAKARLKQGKNRIWAVARDYKGNESNESQEWIVIVDSNKPQITIDSPADGSEFSESSLTVTGLVDEPVSLTINGLFVLQNSDNSFSKEMRLEEGENIISIVARDPAGNETTKKVKVSYSP